MPRADERALEPLGVSRETIARLKTYEALLKKWQHVKNLVSPTTLGCIWERHFQDSLQLLQLAPHAQKWADIGSGAGFPGMVIAIAKAGIPGFSVHLIESDHRKCAFLREVARQTGVAATVEHGRAENIISTFDGIDVVTARAVTSLNKLVEMASPLLAKGATGLFPKGRDYRAELTGIALPSNFTIETAPSLTDDRAAIIIIRGPQSRAPVPGMDPRCA